jgi:hypothetical protein
VVSSVGMGSSLEGLVVVGSVVFFSSLACPVYSSSGASGWFAAVSILDVYLFSLT